MDLELLTAELVLDGIDAEFGVATDDLPSDRVDVLLQVDGFTDRISLQITQIETDPDAMPGVEMFQLWAAFPLELTGEGVERVARFLPVVNTMTPLVGFNVLPDERLVYFRHVGIVSDQPVAVAAILRSVWLAHYALDHLAAGIVQVATDLGE